MKQGMEDARENSVAAWYQEQFKNLWKKFMRIFSFGWTILKGRNGTAI